MNVYLIVLAAGTLLSLLFTPLVTSTALALGLVDAPGGRKVHLVSVPRVGGIAVTAGAGFALTAAAWVEPRQAGWTSLSPLGPILAGAGLVFVIGLIDDLRGLPVWPRLTVQVVAAVVVMASGLLIERITISGETWPLGLLAWPVTLLWIVGLTNAFNFIDGIDGLAAGIAVIVGATCTAILIGRNHLPEALLLVALVGAAQGFLVYNLPPASIFLGDSGSLTFGFVLATTAITGWQKGATALATGVPLLLFALPLADAVTAVFRRSRRRPHRPRITLTSLLHQIVEPDREHIHHRLTRRGWSTRRTVLVLYGITLVLSGIALATANLD
jgi:UDP-GlcNAc:undecaprenyl-phosphate/decaprenyl-phosphate GlcNAc-1-phosphate transferase